MNAKKITFLFVSMSILPYILVSALYKSDIPQREIKKIIEQELTKNFRREVRIGSLTGNLITQTKLHNVVIASEGKIADGTLMEIKQLSARYSLLKAAQKKGDIMAGIDIIDMHHVKMHVVRTKEDKWNLLDFLIPPPLDPNLPPPPPLPFRGKIFIHQMEGTFTDYRGWALESLDDPFLVLFDQVVGIMDFEQLQQTGITVSGRFKNDGSPFSMNGLLNSTNGQYDLNINVPKLETKVWADYLFPIKGFHLSDDEISAYGSLKSKSPFPVNEIPFYYDLHIGYKSLTFKMPFLPEPLRNLKGKLTLHNYRGATLQFKAFEGSVSNIPINGYGSIFLDRGTIDLTVETDPFFIDQLKGPLPVLNIWTYTGQGKAKFKVEGSLAKPKIAGDLMVSEAYFYGLQPTNMTVGFELYDQNFAFNIKDGRLYDGTLSGEGHINLSSTLPDFKMTFRGEKLEAKQVLPNMAEHLASTFDVSTAIFGNWKSYDIQTRVDGTGLKIYQQKIARIRSDMKVDEHQFIAIEKAEIKFLDGGKIKGKGHIKALKNLFLTFRGKEIVLQDVDPESNTDEAGRFSVVGSVEAPLIHGFFQSPKDFVRSETRIGLRNGAFFGQDVGELDVDITYNRGDIDVKTFRLATNNELFSLSGRFKYFLPDGVFIKTKHFNVSDSRLIRSKIPDSWKPFRGQLTADIFLTRSQEGSKSDQKIDLSKIEMKGDVQLVRGMFQEQPFDNVKADVRWDGRRWFISNAELHQKESHIKGGGISSKTSFDLEISQGSKINLDDFREFMSRYGQFSGNFSLSGKVTGSLKKPEIELAFRGTDVQYNQVFMSEGHGKIVYKDDVLHFDPVVLIRDDNEYFAKGYFDLKPILNHPIFKPELLNYNVELTLKKVNLKTTVEVIESLLKEFGKRENASDRNEKIVNANAVEKMAVVENRFAIIDHFAKVAKSHIFDNYSSKHSLGFYDELEQLRNEQQIIEGRTIKSLFDGVLNGQVFAFTRLNRNPIISADFTLDDGKISLLQVKKMSVKITTQGENIQSNVHISQGKLGVSEFTKFHLASVFDAKGFLRIEDIIYESDVTKSRGFLKGRLPLAAFWNTDYTDKTMNLVLTLRGNDIDFLSILSPYIVEIKNEGMAVIKLSGPLYAPQNVGR